MTRYWRVFAGSFVVHGARLAPTERKARRARRSMTGAAAGSGVPHYGHSGAHASGAWVRFVLRS